MSITLRPPIDRYFASENVHDSSAIDRCFAAGGVVEWVGIVKKVIIPMLEYGHTIKMFPTEGRSTPESA